MRAPVALIVTVLGLALAACKGEPTSPAAGGVSVLPNPPGPPWPGTASAVTVGERANCLLATDGTPWCWGNTRGVGLRIDIGLRVDPRGNPEPALDSICLANTPIGQLPGWPCNVFHPVRTSTKTFTMFREAPDDAPPCGVDPSGGAYCWDQGPQYDLNPDSTSAGGLAYCGGTLCLYSPQRVHTSQVLRYYSADLQAPCAVAVSGTVLCAGDNRYNLLGSVTTNFRTDTLIPVLGAPASTAVAVAPDGNFACALATTGKVWCWGDNTYGQAGTNSVANRVTTPTPVASSLNFTSIAASLWTACALATSGQAYCWGDSRAGQVGWGGLGISRTPYPVSGGRTFTAIAASQIHFCALDAGGAAWCWGDNYYGQLGVDRTDCDAFLATPCASVPVQVQGGHTFRQISAGTGQTCGVTTSSEVYCWGWAVYGRLGPVPLTTEFIATPVKITP